MSVFTGVDVGRTRLSRLTFPSVTERSVIGLVALALVAGLAVRIPAARGDLWLDELWSLDLVSRISSPDQVFWGISHDNNHFLTSLWLFFAGQNAAPWVYRLPSLVFGTVAVVVAAQIGARLNGAAAVSAAWLTATSYAVVDYGSEARGYAGLILAILLAYDRYGPLMAALLPADGARPGLAAPGATRKAWQLAAVVLFGTCSHLTMVGLAAILALTTLISLVAAGTGLRSAMDLTVAVFRPSLLLLLPLFGCLVAGVVAMHGFTVGGSVPSSLTTFLHGYGGLVGELSGLADVVPKGVALAIVAVGLGLAFATGLLARSWLALTLVSLLLWPLGLLLARVPNVDYARYFLIAGAILIPLLAEIAGRLWARGGFGRWGAVLLVGCVCAGQIPDIAGLLRDGRGAYTAAVAQMAAAGSPIRYDASNAVIARPVLDTYAQRLGVRAEHVTADTFCARAADWYIADSDFGASVPKILEEGPAACRSTYVRVAAFPSAKWSGRSWTLFRRKA